MELKKKKRKNSLNGDDYDNDYIYSSHLSSTPLSNFRYVSVVQAETDAITDQWFYLVSTWRMKTGLSMYINGKQMAQDKGGVGVQNMKDWTQQDNFFLGRNVGGSGPFFANFYIASFVVFNSYLEAPAVYSVAKYYSQDGKS